MVKHNSKEVIDKIAQDLKVQPAAALPTELSRDIQLTYNCNSRPQILSAAAQVSDSVGPEVILTTSSTKRTFITGLQFSVTTDAAATATVCRVSAQLKGGSAGTSLIKFRKHSATAANLNEQMTYPFPIEIEPGTDIALENNTAVASIDTSCTIFYYEEDPL